MENLPLTISSFLPHPDTTLVTLSLVSLKHQNNTGGPVAYMILCAAQSDNLFSKQCHPSCPVTNDAPHPGYKPMVTSPFIVLDALKFSLTWIFVEIQVPSWSHPCMHPWLPVAFFMFLAKPKDQFHSR